jgi:hypothetical protein
VFDQSKRHLSAPVRSHADRAATNLDDLFATRVCAAMSLGTTIVFASRIVGRIIAGSWIDPVSDTFSLAMFIATTGFLAASWRACERAKR